MPANHRLELFTFLLAGLTLFSSGCVTHSHATEFHGVDGLRGVPIEYQSTTTYSLHLLFVLPLWGDGSKTKAIDEFTAEAAANGATRTRISQTSSLTWWFLLPPISFFVHPVVTTVEGDVETGALP